METGLADLSQEFRNTAEHFGSWGLELVAVRGYLNRLMDNSKVVRHLAHHFPKQLAQFQGILETDPIN
ncbi:plasmid partitioning protein RepB C-terminal domain-containing protein [Mesorhizobium kowhaii]|nr:plasmid partitioning protein RepB C-terminal domain-containing protein [Mesorhizobium kowhaii]